MENERPEKIAIEHDDYHARHIGRTGDGRQFFLTTPFEPAYRNREGCEYIALFLFDLDGNLIESRVDTLGPRATLDADACREKYDSRLNELGEVDFQRIEVKPFAINHNGVEMGLIVREPEEEEDEWAVELQPGNYMAFFEPWDSGVYDT